MKGIIITKGYAWECDCGANGYELTRKDAEARSFEHRQSCINAIRKEMKLKPITNLHEN